MLEHTHTPVLEHTHIPTLEHIHNPNTRTHTYLKARIYPKTHTTPKTIQSFSCTFI